MQHGAQDDTPPSCFANVFLLDRLQLAAVLPLLFFFTRSGVFLFYLGFWGFYWKSRVF